MVNYTQSCRPITAALCRSAVLSACTTPMNLISFVFLWRSPKGVLLSSTVATGYVWERLTRSSSNFWSKNPTRGRSWSTWAVASEYNHESMSEIYWHSRLKWSITLAVLHEVSAFLWWYHLRGHRLQRSHAQEASRHVRFALLLRSTNVREQSYRVPQSSTQC